MGWTLGIPPVLEIIILIAAAVGAVYTLHKTVWKPLKHVYQRWNSGMDTLLGYDAVKDPGTGKEIQPRTLPLAHRVWELEQTNKKVAEALEVLAQNQTIVVDLQNKWDEREKTGNAIIAEWTAWRDAHELETQERHQQVMEWEVWRSEQQSLWELVRTHFVLEGQKNGDVDNITTMDE